MTNGDFSEKPKPGPDNPLPAVAGAGAAGTWSAWRPRKSYAPTERQGETTEETAAREAKIQALVMSIIATFEEPKNKNDPWLQASVDRLLTGYKERATKELEEMILKLHLDWDKPKEVTGTLEEGVMIRDEWFAIALALEAKRKESLQKPQAE